MDTILLVLSLSVLMLTFIVFRQRSVNEELRASNEELKVQVIKSKSDKELLVSIDPGDRAIIPSYSLVYGKGAKDEHHFEVTYEVEVVEVTLDKVKVKATGFTTNDSVTNNDPSRKAGVINYMQDKWIKRKDIELVVDNTMRRDAKLQELL